MARSYAPYLEMDDEGIVTLTDPIGPDDDAVFVDLGHVATAADETPEELQGDLDRLYREWVAEVAGSPGGGRVLRRMYREGSIR